MKTLIGLLVSLVTVSGYLINVPVSPIEETVLAPSGWIHLQKLILPLFENVCEKSGNPTVVRLSDAFWTTTSAVDFWDADCFTKLQQLKSTNGFLAKGEIFTEYNPDHVTELKIVFDVLKNAKSFDTFYKAASWARQNLNCGLFVDAIYLAMVNRIDTEKLNLPAPYELLPNYFIRKDIIIQGSSILAGQEVTPSEGIRDEGTAYTLDANYTANILDSDDESKLAYFREDVGLNSYYFLNMLKYAPWRSIDNINSRYGEEMFLWMKQWMSRYNLERYSNGLAELEGINWDIVSDTPYDPMLVYSNGNEFSSSQINIEENEDKDLLKIIEANLVTVVEHMRDVGYNKTQILNHLMEILVTGEKSYETLARRLLGKSLGNNGSPSVLEHYMTSLRDPMFWKLNKKIVNLIDHAIKILPAYTKNELYFPGVEVVNVEVKKMMTNFENFEFDITDALKIGNDDTTFHVKIGQLRLNRKPFTIKINITSLVTQRGLLKVYLGPKVIPGEFSKKKNLFTLLDSFDINLKKGTNIVTRSLEDTARFSRDFVSLRTLYKNVEHAQFGLDTLPLNSIESQIQYPSRMVLPRGTLEGLPLQLFVFVAPYIKTSLTGTYSTATTEFNEVIMSKLYPLDLPIDDNTILGLPNLMFKDITVTYKGGSGGSGPKTDYTRPSQPNTWGGGKYGPDNNMPETNTLKNARPFSGPRQAPYDYRSKLTYQKPAPKTYVKFDYKNIIKDVTVAPLHVPTEATLRIPSEMPENIEIIDAQGIRINNDDYKVLGLYEMQNDSPVEEAKPVFNYKSKQISQKLGKFDYKNLIKDKKNNDKLEPSMKIPMNGSSVKHVDIEISRVPYLPVDKKDKKIIESETEESKDMDSVRIEVVNIPYVVYDKNEKKIKASETEETEDMNSVRVEVVKIPYITYDKSEKNYIESDAEEAKDMDSVEILNIFKVDDENKEVPLLKMSEPMKKAFTLYDFIIRSFVDDKVQEVDGNVDAQNVDEKENNSDEKVVAHRLFLINKR